VTVEIAGTLESGDSQGDDGNSWFHLPRFCQLSIADFNLSGMGLQAQFFAWAMCHLTLSSIDGFFGILFFSCQALFNLVIA
jgi:hypothetical protein